MLELQEVTAQLGNWGGYFFFCLKEQDNNADDHKAELKQLWICNHQHPLLSQEGKRSVLPPREWEETTALKPRAASLPPVVPPGKVYHSLLDCQ